MHQNVKLQSIHLQDVSSVKPEQLAFCAFFSVILIIFYTFSLIACNSLLSNVCTFLLCKLISYVCSYLNQNEMNTEEGEWVIADQMIISGQVAETEPCLSLACGWWRQEGEKEEPWPWAHLSLHYLPSLKQHTESVETWVQSWEEIWLSVKGLCLWFYEQVRLGFSAHETGHLTTDTAEKHTQRLQYLSILHQ